MALHTKYLKLIGYLASEIGTLNQVITMWGYDDMQQRDHFAREAPCRPPGSRSAPRQLRTSRP